VTIREATPDDAGAIADIVIACWRLAYRGVLPDAALDRDTRDERIARIRKRLADWPTFVVDDIATSRLAPVGRHGFDAEIDGLYVHPDASRSGIGRALVRHACTRFADAGKRTLLVETLRDNRIGRAFYDKLGGRVAVESTWVFEGLAYPSVGYGWDDLRSLSA
jgi:ribosomal protein S18 acetylase RimI-like enzyme